MLTPPAVAQLRRSVAMLPPASPEGLGREVALDVLTQLEELHAAHRRCPHCGHELTAPAPPAHLPD